MYKRIMSIILIASAIVLGDNSEIHIKYTDLDTLLLSSLQFQFVNKQHTANRFNTRKELEWQNPEFEFERESLTGGGDKEKETVFLLGKEVMLPWAGYFHRSARNSEIKSIRLSLENDQLSLQAALKADYIQLVVFKDKIKRLESLDSLMVKALNIAEQRYEQGTLSGIQNKLVQLSRFNFQRDRFLLSREFSESLNRFKTNLGIASDQSIVFDTTIKYYFFQLAPFNQYAQQLAQHPKLVSLYESETAAQNKVRFEKISVVSSIHLSGGYKKLNENMDGYVAGITVPLPILNQNKNSVQKEKAVLEQSQIDTRLTKTRISERLGLVYSAIQDQQNYFDQFVSAFDTADNLVNDIVFSFYEGNVTFGEILDAYQIYMDSIDTYYEQLVLYYNYLLELEYLTQMSIVKF